MEKINHKKILMITLIKIVGMLVIFFTINNWVNIKQSVNGDVPVLNEWMNHAFTPSNLIVAVMLSIVFYMNTLKHHKELAEKRSKYTEI
ncbi:hypothetical protein WG904_00885 [Pedobacter sp. Du54]|uniref:hypothetical protein n=1 Tax=Pedobacter anseongensis TaxID=3133439 RepID=UPI0030A87193